MFRSNFCKIIHFMIEYCSELTKQHKFMLFSQFTAIANHHIFPYLFPCTCRFVYTVKENVHIKCLHKYTCKIVDLLYVCFTVYVFW